jgi:hypothetical protein
MDPIVVITGTLTSRVDGSVVDVVYAIPYAGLQLLAIWFSELFVLLVFVMANEFQMWSLMLVLILAVMYVPLALTGFAPMAVFLSGFFIIISGIVRFFFKLGG